MLLDYRKAFDMIDHNILYEKLQGIGVRLLVLKWILDFLHGRFQRVKLIIQSVSQIGNQLCRCVTGDQAWPKAFSTND